jgi:Predicted transcriptional regulators
MYSISQLCKTFHLSRSTLLYYDSIGLFSASLRTASNYRRYSEADKERLEKICLYREAGVSLEQIKLLLVADKDSKESVFQRRLAQINNEISLLRLQQKIILELLERDYTAEQLFMMDTNTLISLLKSSGMNDNSLKSLHREFEKHYPKGHQTFLEFLGMDHDTIRLVREEARTTILGSSI